MLKRLILTAVLAAAHALQPAHISNSEPVTSTDEPVPEASTDEEAWKICVQQYSEDDCTFTRRGIVDNNSYYWSDHDWAEKFKKAPGPQEACSELQLSSQNAHRWCLGEYWKHHPVQPGDYLPIDQSRRLWDEGKSAALSENDAFKLSVEGKIEEPQTFGEHNPYDEGTKEHLAWSCGYNENTTLWGNSVGAVYLADGCERLRKYLGETENEELYGGLYGLRNPNR